MDQKELEQVVLKTTEIKTELEHKRRALESQNRDKANALLLRMMNSVSSVSPEVTSISLGVDTYA